MKDLLVHVLKKFLHSRFVEGRPLLLGYSGGPDSKALLYALLACSRFFSFKLHVAHIDHGWRQESAQEAEELKREIEGLGLVWHLYTAEQGAFTGGNLEEKGRLIRMRFFSELYRSLDCQALLLGHQGDDQAEVVLKRIFEGAHLSALGGLREDSEVAAMQIWRPLLSCKKEELISWLRSRHIHFLEDPTNRSEQFLRGKMRERMLPFLAGAFGKEISGNLCYLGEQARELKEYFHHLNAPFLGTASKTLDLSQSLPLPYLQLKYLIKEWLTREQLIPSRQIVEGIMQALSKKGDSKTFCFKGAVVFVQNGVISI